jgi:dethiobiotin synthetase
MIGLGVTGTDTGVGKTVVSCATIAALRATGARVAAMKPVESGGSDDSACLQRAVGAAYPMRLVCPVSLPDPLAPLVAARRAGVTIDMCVLDDAFHELCSDADAVVVEGAGGLLVPITETESFATLFRRWNLDLLIVAPNRLGTINNTLLTVRAARDYGFTIRAVVLNTVSSQPEGIAELTNPALLRELLPDIPVVSVAFSDWPAKYPQITLQDLGIDNVA